MTQANSFLLLLGVFALTACGTINPDSPEIVVTEFEVPRQELSSIQIPIRINLAPYFKETEQSVPKSFSGNEQYCDGVSFSYKFFRDPIQFEGMGKRLFFDVEGKYALRLNYCPSCTDVLGRGPSCIIPRIYASCGVDEPMRKVHVGYETQIGLSSQYSLTSTTKLRKVKALSPCEITVFSYNATETIEEELTKALQDVERDIDKEISAVNLKPEMEATWKLLQEPTYLEGYGYMYIRPSKIAVSEIKFKGDTAYFNALLQARPTIYTTEQKLRQKPLPRLSNYEAQEGFDITMDIFATYDSLSTILSNNIRGTKVDMSGKEVVFGNIDVHGAANRKIHLRVEFSGSKKGVLYLTGTPEFDTLKQHISFPDLEFDVETKSALLKSAKWLFSKKVTNAIRDAASMDVQPYLDTLKASLDASLNFALTEGVRMNGHIDDVKIKLIYPKTDELHLRVHSKGKLEINM